MLVQAQLRDAAREVQMVPDKYPATGVRAYNGSVPGPILRALATLAQARLLLGKRSG